MSTARASLAEVRIPSDSSRKHGQKPTDKNPTLDNISGRDGSFVLTGACMVRIPFGLDICNHSCAYTVLQTVQRHGVYNAAYDTVHYKEPLKSF